ncbi:CTP synthase (glutamine hydrolyzing) [Candidatus Woesearchaeota archaeon]|nr:MAG: CTP synthase (glutamine hydrolyzing) [Candidatus Woesearchaeota archaeon]
MQTIWVVTTGGVLSGIGKGVASAAIARLLKGNKKIVTMKCDGYLNVDPGTMNPVEHGEVFVLHDGGEVDMDFGHYERFLDVNCKFEWNLTSGKIFDSVITKERKGVYLGKTIQIFPHIVDEIKSKIYDIAKKEFADIMFIEIGGTVGDIENSWFIEAVRQLRNEVGNDKIVYIHLTYIPYLETVTELKTKPAQRDIALLREKGIYPDIVIARSKFELTPKIKEKLALFGDIDAESIITGKDVDSVYEVPLFFRDQNIVQLLNRKLHMKHKEELVRWEELVNTIKHPEHRIKVAICGKYTELHDSYASVIEALKHAGAHLNTGVDIVWLETTDIEKNKVSVKEALKNVNGVIIPGGFGSRGVEGKIQVIQHLRENNIPFLGLCYGLQLAVIEFARHVCNLTEANTTEVKKTKVPVIDILPEQKNVDKLGGTMRLGAYEAVLLKGSVVQQLYNAEKAVERHRHRYEVNPEYHQILQEKGMVFSGMSADKRLVEFIELPNHPYFVATQAHNELTSRLEKPNPLFYGFVKAALKK